MEQKKPTLSIVTPSYNRAHLLDNCYQSLLNQTNYDFEWILVDDGSIDNTAEVLRQYIDNKGPFNIFYVHKENGGKHTALNASHPYIHGEYVLLLDSDDILTSDAVDTVISGWNKYKDDCSIAMIVFVKKNTNGQICAYSKDENVPLDVLHHKRICISSSDCCEVIRASLFKKYPFPVFEGENFLAETALWYRAGLDGNCIYINKVIYMCEYLEDGLSKSGRKMRIKNPHGGMYTSFLRMNKRCYIKERIKAAMLFVCYGHFAGKKMCTLFGDGKPYQKLIVLCYLPGTLLYRVWSSQYR